MSSRKDVNTNF